MQYSESISESTSDKVLEYQSKFFQIKYLDGVVDLSCFDVSDASLVKNLWSKVREDYTDWAADVRLQEISGGKNIVELFQWKGMSTWWLNRLVQKNSYIDCAWINRLMVLYLCRHYSGRISLNTDDVLLVAALEKNKIDVKVCFDDKINKYLAGLKMPVLNSLRTLLSLGRQLERWLLVRGKRKCLASEKSTVDSRVWFKTLYPINWTDKTQEIHCDRLFEHTPLMDGEYGFNASYLVYLFKSNKNSAGFFKLRKSLSELEAKSERLVYFPESTLTIVDIVNAYVSTAREYFKFRKLTRRNDFRNLFVIDSMDVSDILFDEWTTTYLGMQQYAKLQGIASSKFYRGFEGQQIQINYSEFFTQNRAAYYLTKEVNPKVKFVSVQHALNAKNKIFTYYRRNEFCYDGKNHGVKYSPYPDYFLIHGAKYQKILAEFYDVNRISIIGALKSISCPVHCENNEEYTSLLRHRDLGGRTILLAPSTGPEYKNILALFELWDHPKNWHILLTAHPTQNIHEIELYQRLKYPKLKIRYITSLRTNALFPLSDIVVAGFSSVAIEAHVCNTTAIRVVPLGTLPQFDEDTRIPRFSNSDTFMRWFKDHNASFSDQKYEHKKIINDEIIRDYMYRNDGKSGQRLWEFVKKLESHEVV